MAVLKAFHAFLQYNFAIIIADIVKRTSPQPTTNSTTFKPVAVYMSVNIYVLIGHDKLGAT